MSNILSQLNSEQKKAVENIFGPTLVIAGAGSGKTRALTYKVAYLIEQKISPHEILVLTFTNKAANEMKSRIVELVGDKSRFVTMGTFHSVFSKILRYESEKIGYQSNYTIYDSDDSKSFMKNIMDDLGISTQQYKPNVFCSIISKAKNKLVSPIEFTKNARGLFEEKIALCYEEYQNRLKKSNAMDFDDLILKPIELFSRFPKVLEKYQEKFKFILVDEYQDTNKVQYTLIKMFAEKNKNICVVGDDSQSIYSFRGADIRNILDFQIDYSDCKTFRLEQNYRSTKNILESANCVIKNNFGKIPKNLWTENQNGEKITILICKDEKDEGEIISKKVEEEIRKLKLNLKDVAILYRTNAQSRAIEDAFRKFQIPYRIVGGIEFYKRKEIKDVLAYLKFISNPNDNESLNRIINFPSRGIGETSLNKIKNYANEKKINFFEALNNIEKIEEIQKRTKDAIQKFTTCIWKYIDLRNKISLSEFSKMLIEEIAILNLLKEEGTIESMSKWENIQELLSGISEYENEKESSTLEEFLQDISLLTNVDNLNTENNSVTLMTLHSAKGLEYPIVFVAGVEEGLLPLSNGFSFNDEEVEEERRLMYVGITRAMAKLYLTLTKTRFRFGDLQYSTPSRFISEIDKKFYTEENSNKIFLNESFYNKKKYDDYIDETFNSENDTKKVYVGSRVSHETFGSGRVISINENGSKVTVNFDKYGKKQLLLMYANLKPITF